MPNLTDKIECCEFREPTRLFFSLKWFLLFSTLIYRLQFKNKSRNCSDKTHRCDHRCTAHTCNACNLSETQIHTHKHMSTCTPVHTHSQTKMHTRTLGIEAANVHQQNKTQTKRHPVSWNTTPLKPWRWEQPVHVHTHKSQNLFIVTSLCVCFHAAWFVYRCASVRAAMPLAVPSSVVAREFVFASG